eukprot:1234533-Prymnesium_polylepis.3
MATDCGAPSRRRAWSNATCRSRSPAPAWLARLCHTGAGRRRRLGRRHRRAAPAECRLLPAGAWKRVRHLHSAEFGRRGPGAVAACVQCGRRPPFLPRHLALPALGESAGPADPPSEERTAADARDVRHATRPLRRADDQRPSVVARTRSARRDGGAGASRAHVSRVPADWSDGSGTGAERLRRGLAGSVGRRRHGTKPDVRRLARGARHPSRRPRPRAGRARISRLDGRRPAPARHGHGRAAHGRAARAGLAVGARLRLVLRSRHAARDAHHAPACARSRAVPLARQQRRDRAVLAAQVGHHGDPQP